MSIAFQGRRAIAPLAAEPSPLVFVTGGDPRVEVLRCTPGTRVAGGDGLTFSVDNGLTWPTAALAPDDGTTNRAVVLARYSPGEVREDANRPLSLTLNGDAYHAEALELRNVPAVNTWELTVLRSAPRAYRDDSDALVAVLRALAWASYPARALAARNEVLDDPSLAPSHLRERSRSRLGLPPLAGLSVPRRRAVLAAAARYYALGGTTAGLADVIEAFTASRPAITGAGAFALLYSLGSIPADVAAWRAMVSYWTPAWVDWDALVGPGHDGTLSYDGAATYGDASTIAGRTA